MLTYVGHNLHQNVYHKLPQVSSSKAHTNIITSSQSCTQILVFFWDDNLLEHVIRDRFRNNRTSPPASTVYSHSRCLSSRILQFKINTDYSNRIHIYTGERNFKPKYEACFQINLICFIQCSWNNLTWKIVSKSSYAVYFILQGVTLPPF